MAIRYVIGADITCINRVRICCVVDGMSRVLAQYGGVTGVMIAIVAGLCITEFAVAGLGNGYVGLQHLRLPFNYFPLSKYKYCTSM